MAPERRRLNQLRTGESCHQSWDGMEERPGGRRYCDECSRQVFDFRQMTPRDIRAHLEASQGKLCARLTFESGRLQVLQPEVKPPPPPPSRRASPLAATLFGLWLGAGAAQAQAPATPAAPAEPAQSNGEGAKTDRPTTRERHPAQNAGANLNGQIVDQDGFPVPGTQVMLQHASSRFELTTITDNEGLFAFENLPTGLYDLSGHIEGFRIEAQRDILLHPDKIHRADLLAELNFELITMGAMVMSQSTVQELFAGSDLVVEAVVGTTEIVTSDSETATLQTDLRIETVLKGEPSGHSVACQQTVYLPALEDGAIDARDHTPEPDTKIIAFLDRGEETAGSMPHYVQADFFSSLRPYDEETLEVYIERLEELAGLHQQAGTESIDPADWMEWLVDTVENPHTRSEALGEIDQALEALKKVVNWAQVDEELVIQGLQVDLDRWRITGKLSGESPRPAYLGASMTEDQKDRLAQVLSETEGLTPDDRALFRLVNRWAPDKATQWLERQLRTATLEPLEQESVWWLVVLASDLEDESATALSEATKEQLTKIQELGIDDSDENWQQQQQEIVKLRKAAQQQLAEILAANRQ